MIETILESQAESAYQLEPVQVQLGQWRTVGTRLPERARLGDLSWSTVFAYCRWAAFVALVIIVGLLGGILFLPFCAVLATALGVFSKPCKFTNTPKSLTDMMDLPSPGPQFPVCIKLYANNRYVGKDYGTVTFLDDTMYFEGQRTSFELLTSILVGNLRTIGPVWNRLDWSLNGYSGHLWIAAYDRIGTKNFGNRARFNQAIRNFGWATWTGRGSVTLPPVFRDQAALSEVRRDAPDSKK